MKWGPMAGPISISKPILSNAISFESPVVIESTQRDVPRLPICVRSRRRKENPHSRLNSSSQFSIVRRSGLTHWRDRASLDQYIAELVGTNFAIDVKPLLATPD